MARLNASLIHSLANPTGLMKATDRLVDAHAGLLKDVTYGKKPTLDANDPESIKAYMESAQKRGELSTGQASQLGYMQQNAQERIAKAEEKKTTERQTTDRNNLVTGYLNAQKQVEKMEAAVFAAEKNGTPAAVEAAKRRLQSLETARDAIKGQIDSDPVARAALRKEEDAIVLAEDRKQLAANRRQAAQDAQREAAIQQEITPLLAELNAGTLEPTDPRMGELQERDPEAFNKFSELAAPILKNRKAEEKALDEGKELPAEYFEGMPENAYKAYKAHYSVAPTAANKAAIAQHKTFIGKIIAEKGATKPAFKFTESVRNSAEDRIRSTMLKFSKAEGPMQKERSFIGKLFNDDDTYETTGKTEAGKELGRIGQKDARVRAFSGSVLSRLEEAGLEPTTKNIERMVIEELKYRDIDTAGLELSEDGASEVTAEKSPASNWMDSLSAEDKADAKALKAEGFSEAEIKEALSI